MITTIDSMNRMSDAPRSAVTRPLHRSRGRGRAGMPQRRAPQARKRNPNPNFEHTFVLANRRAVQGSVSELARVLLADLNGPKLTPLGQNRLANAKIRFAFDQHGCFDRFGPFGPVHLPTVLRPLLAVGPRVSRTPTRGKANVLQLQTYAFFTLGC